MLAEIITIGDEILIGQIVDTNSAWMAVRLNEIGVEVKQITTVADRASDILMALNLASGRADVVLMTGGLGPTKDDITKHTLATFFGQGLRRDTEVLKHVEGIFKRSDRALLEVNRQQADVLEKADVLFNSLGTAPGMWISHKNRHYVVLPGVPFEMKHLMEERVLPRLKFFKGRTPMVHHTLLTAGLGESFLAERVQEIESHLPPHIHLAYLPKPGVVRLRLTGIGSDQKVLEQKVEYFAQELAVACGPYFMAHGDVNLAEVVLEAFQRQGLKLAAAESCTGGYIASLLTAIPGSSVVFQGSAVTYSNQSKSAVLGIDPIMLEKHGAVSEEIVVEMAKGARKVFDADYALAVSGVAGPGPDQDGLPAGHIWMAVLGPQGVRTRLFQFGSDRSVNIERAAALTLFELLSLLREEAK